VLKIWFLRLAAVYFVIGVSLGYVMSVTESFVQMPVHAHVNLLGWVSMALFGLIYFAWPAAADTKLAKAHFALYNIGLPIMLIGLSVFLGGAKAAGPVIGLGATLVVVGILCFAINLFRQVKV
jgi:cbb3-type cytochrome oxidase subunit 1